MHRAGLSGSPPDGADVGETWWVDVKNKASGEAESVSPRIFREEVNVLYRQVLEDGKGIGYRYTGQAQTHTHTLPFTCINKQEAENFLTQ